MITRFISSKTPMLAEHFSKSSVFYFCSSNKKQGVKDMDSIELNSGIKLSEKFSEVNKGIESKAIEVKENDYALIQELFPHSEKAQEIRKIQIILNDALLKEPQTVLKNINWLKEQMDANKKV